MSRPGVTGGLLAVVPIAALAVLNLIDAGISTIASYVVASMLCVIGGYLVGWFGEERKRVAAANHQWIVDQRNELLERERSARAAAELAQRRSRVLAAEALQAEQTARRRISESMHDDAIQSLLAASQDIKEAARGQLDSLDRAAEALDQAIAQLRDAVFELHPVTLEYGGLEQALKAIAKRQGRRGRYHTRVRVNSEAVGVHDMLVVAVGRELLTNIAKHATASEVLVDLARTDTSIVLQVSDDGRGMEPAQRQVALRHGHIGLVSIAERVAAVGGTLDIMSEVGHGTVVRVRLPSGPSWGPLRCRAKGGAVQLAPGSR